MNEKIRKTVPISETEHEKINVSLLSYSYASEERSYVFNTNIAPSDLVTLANFTQGDLSQSARIQSNIVLAYLSSSDKIEQYMADLASLNVSKGAMVVFALISREKKEEIKTKEKELAAEHILYLPDEEAQLKKLLKTIIVSLKIVKTKKQSRLTRHAPSSSLGEILVKNSVITSEQLKKALEYQKGTSERLGEVLVSLEYIDEDQKVHFLASQLGVPAATQKMYASIDMSTVAKIPERIAKLHHCLALAINGEELSVVMIDVLDLQLLDTLRDVTDFRINPLLGKASDIDAALDRMYRDIASHKEITDLVPQIQTSVHAKEDSEEQVNLEEMAAQGAELGIVKLVNMFFANSIRDKASDIHIEPMEKEVIVRYRIDGRLRKMMNSPKRTHQPIITRLKILSNLDIAERRLPQDGRMVVNLGEREVDIRVSILPTIFGEKAVLRILDKDAFERNISNLGFTGYDQNIFSQQIVKPYGMIIVTGPTGSGKSTTLYSALQQIKSVSKNIITVEDPVEFHMDRITQVQVNSKIGLTFASALRSILRQDPDIILVGEIRDEETADIAIKMALTGHLVFSTLHTNDAASAIMRFVDIGIPPLLLSSSLNLVVAQRLVRKVCTHCKELYEASNELVAQLNLTSDQNKTFYRGEGCVHCNGSGYYGRTGVYEMIGLSPEIRKMILGNASTMDIQNQAKKDGMKTLRQAGLDLANKGITTIEEVIAVTTD